MDAASYGFTVEEETQANGGESFPEAVFETAGKGDESTDPRDF